MDKKCFYKKSQIVSFLNKKTNFYAVTAELWEKYGVGKGMLCLECFRKRLGMDFRKEDFPPYLAPKASRGVAGMGKQLLPSQYLSKAEIT